MKKILLLLVFSLSFMVANAQKVKIVENYEENGVKYTRLSPKIFAFKERFSWHSICLSQALFAITGNDTTQYFISILTGSISSKGVSKENAIVKLMNDSIIELPVYDTEEIDLGTSITSTTTYYNYSKLFKSSKTYAEVHDNKAKYVIYFISQENMDLMCDIGVEKLRFIAKDKIVDLPSVKNQITDCYRKGVKMIKEAQSSYSRYNGL